MGIASIDAIVEKFPELVTWHSGNKSASAHSPCSSAKPIAAGLCFCQEAAHLEACFKTKVAILVVPPELAETAANLNSGDNPGDSPGDSAILTSDELQSAMAKLNTEFFLPQWGRQPFDQQQLHPSAIIHPSAKLHETVIVHPNAVIGPDVTIAEQTLIGANTTLEGNIQVGKRCLIKANVFVGHSVQIGDDCRIEPQSSIGTDGFGYGTNRAGEQKGKHFAKPHFGKVILKDRVEIGSGVQIDRGTFDDTIVGAGTKMDNHSHFAHNTVIGEDCLITAGLITAGSTTIGNNCVLAGRVSINGHINICDGVTMGPMAGVTGDITKPGVYGGFPPVPYKDFLKNQASTTSLAEMRKNVNKILKKLEVR